MIAPVIELQDVTVRFDGRDRPALDAVSFAVPEGELVLVVGPTGSGKSTLLRCLNGLVPHFTGGHLAGHVVVVGRDTREHRPRDLADLVGMVGQDPASSFVTDTVEEEIAYGMELLGLGPQAMRRRVEETLDVLGLADLRHRPLTELSGGQQQRVAIGAVFAAGPRILVLDEPTSALDPVAAEDVLAALHRLVHDLGVTVVLAEHRLERVIHHADDVLLVDDGRVSSMLAPEEAMAVSRVYPPVIGLGRLAHWSPLPLSVRDARRRAGELRGRLDPDAAVADPRTATASATDTTANDGTAANNGTAASSGAGGATGTTTGSIAHLRRLLVHRDTVTALRDVTLDLAPGSVTALMGRNGAGKSTLLATLAGQLRPTAGVVSVDGVVPAETAPAQLVKRVGLVPQDCEVLLYADSVAAECAGADADFGVAPGTTAALLARLAGDLDPATHPRDLSEGQRLALALSIILAGQPRVLLLDEPTRGLDYAAKARLAGILRELTGRGHAVVLATHDVEIVADVADRVLILAEGEVVADGPAPRVLTGSPAFAPQVAKILQPLPFLTVDAVAEALERAS
ncbi:MAG TPA: ATP-binding cassette domain-containing protein [Segeticoccus sp.]|uniref:ABC transporter ATP-binding protein n=1 Tax=Segeticoccus sp. TaxID=2706531 RepID=UPI002D7F1137|nr:ATP-binding cassette domain-containing protein [Segeticoccus sp.]HET8600358.1 ATP-binding cassette domain-containing protein [Segeticoccus sp.]